MGTNYRLLVYSLLVIGFISCNKELEPIFIIKKSTEAHGGIESWKNLKSLSFTKKTNLYKEDGSLKSTILQNQKFDFENNLSISLNSILDSVKCNLQNGKVTIQNKDSIYRPVGEELNKTQALFSFAMYVTSQPFQLLESGASFERIKDTLVNNKRVLSILVHYKNEGIDSDKWTYYFDPNSFEVTACKVRHNGRESLIENTSYDKSTPFLFNRRRKSTILENGKPKFVFAEYKYMNYRVEMR